MKSRDGKSQRREAKRREEKRRGEETREEKRREEERRKKKEERRPKKRKSQKKEDPGARKGRKVAKHCVPPMICGSGGRTVGSLKRRVRSHLARWEMKSCTPLRREAHFQVKMYKAHQGRTTFGSWDVEKCTLLWREADFQVKMHKTQHVRTTFGSWDARSTFQVKKYKTHQLRTTFGSWDVEKVNAVVARSTFRSQNVKNTRGSDHFWTFRCRSAWQAQGIVDLVSEQNVRVLQLFQKRWQAWGIWRGSAKMHFPWQAQYKRHVHQRCWEVRALISWEGLHFGASDLQVCYDDFSWEAQHFVWPGITFSWQAQYSRQMEWKNRKTHWYEADSSAFNFPFLKEVSHNCFVFDVVNVENWGSLAELLRFWRCQGQKLRKSRRLAVLLILSSSKMEDVSQNCCVFKLADRQTDTHRQTDRQTNR